MIKCFFNLLFIFIRLLFIPFFIFIHLFICFYYILLFWKCLFFFIFQNGKYSKFSYFKYDYHARSHLFSLSLIFKLWNNPHYRTGTFKEDLLNNLCNTAIPGTGIPLSLFIRFKILSYIFIFILYPFINIIIAILNNIYCNNTSTLFYHLLFHPTDWFTFWRINCALTSYHSNIYNLQAYNMENKWEFLKTAKEYNIPVSDWKTCYGVILHNNSNIYSPSNLLYYQNVTENGEWIIQERIENSLFLKEFLPNDAPLSTFRVVTGWKLNNNNNKKKDINTIIPFSCVLRAGLSNAPTDHVSILFNVNKISGEIGKGTTNNHWYRIGLTQIGKRPITSKHSITHHPDSNKIITGRYVKEIKELISIAQDAHLRLLPEIPLAGWDLVLTDKGIILLEVNLSCNFFRGEIDNNTYFNFLNDYYILLEQEEYKKHKEK